MILAGNQTQVTFSGIIPLDHQDFCRYYQYSSSEQKSDCLYHIYVCAQPETVQGRVGFLKLGHFDRYFLKKSRMKGPTAENFGALWPPPVVVRLIWKTSIQSKTSNHRTAYATGKTQVWQPMQWSMWLCFEVPSNC